MTRFRENEVVGRWALKLGADMYHEPTINLVDDDVIEQRHIDIRFLLALSRGEDPFYSEPLRLNNWDPTVHPRDDDGKFAGANVRDFLDKHVGKGASIVSIAHIKHYSAANKELMKKHRGTNQKTEELYPQGVIRHAVGRHFVQFNYEKNVQQQQAREGKDADFDVGPIWPSKAHPEGTATHDADHPAIIKHIEDGGASSGIEYLRARPVTNKQNKVMREHESWTDAATGRMLQQDEVKDLKENLLPKKSGGAADQGGIEKKIPIRSIPLSDIYALKARNADQPNRKGGWKKINRQAHQDRPQAGTQLSRSTSYVGAALIASRNPKFHDIMAGLMAKSDNKDTDHDVCLSNPEGHNQYTNNDARLATKAACDASNACRGARAGKAFIDHSDAAKRLQSQGNYDQASRMHDEAFHDHLELADKHSTKDVEQHLKAADAHRDARDINRAIHNQNHRSLSLPNVKQKFDDLMLSFKDLKLRNADDIVRDDYGRFAAVAATKIAGRATTDAAIATDKACSYEYPPNRSEPVKHDEKAAEMYEESSKLHEKASAANKVASKSWRSMSDVDPEAEARANKHDENAAAHDDHAKEDKTRAATIRQRNADHSWSRDDLNLGGEDEARDDHGRWAPDDGGNASGGAAPMKVGKVIHDASGNTRVVHSYGKGDHKVVAATTGNEHEMMRILTMDDHALANRINKITNKDKMDKFVQALKKAGKKDLAKQASLRAMALSHGLDFPLEFNGTDWELSRSHAIVLSGGRFHNEHGDWVLAWTDIAREAAELSRKANASGKPEDHLAAADAHHNAYKQAMKEGLRPMAESHAKFEEAHRDAAKGLPIAASMIALKLAGNPNHDEHGRFTSSEGDSKTGGGSEEHMDKVGKSPLMIDAERRVAAAKGAGDGLQAQARTGDSINAQHSWHNPSPDTDGPAKWHEFAGGDYPSVGHKLGFTATSKWGEYHINPVSSHGGKFNGYHVNFANAGRGAPGLPHQGLWHDVGNTRSANAAKKMAREHHATISKKS